MTPAEALEALLAALDIPDTDHIEIIAEQAEDGWTIDVEHGEIARVH